ncbi:phosphotransferase [Geodermatophilus sp. CPCC 205761]|uniref:phosphotransferase n=1 Tax=Geodermatophilus sp. CPCC 205761 TaxID=2936597 RepID=UPI003EEE98C0
MVTYRVRWLSGDAVVATPDRRSHALARHTWTPPSGPRFLVRALVSRVFPSTPVTIASRGGDGLPAAIAASRELMPGRLDPAPVAVDVRDRRRRAVAVLPGEQGAARVVVKVSRSPGEDDRAGREQVVLSLLRDTGVAPRALGSGRAGGVAWSAESAVRGRALRDVLSHRRAPVELVLGRLTACLGDIAARTARPMEWGTAVGPGDEVVALRGPAVGLRDLLADLQGVPAVLVHGDLGGGHNVIVDASARIAVVDWETARERGLPLLDLIAVVCATLAGRRSRDDLRAQADFVVSLASGRGPQSAWFLGQVARYAARLSLPRDSIARLALLAWGHQASMRHVRNELLVTAGIPAAEGAGLGELVLPRWQDRIGTRWVALDDHLPSDRGHPPGAPSVRRGASGVRGRWSGSQGRGR